MRNVPHLLHLFHLFHDTVLIGGAIWKVPGPLGVGPCRRFYCYIASGGLWGISPDPLVLTPRPHASFLYGCERWALFLLPLPPPLPWMLSCFLSQDGLHSLWKFKRKWSFSYPGLPLAMIFYWSSRKRKVSKPMRMARHTVATYPSAPQLTGGGYVTPWLSPTLIIHPLATFSRTKSFAKLRL